MNRRQFIQLTGASLAAPATFFSASARANTPPRVIVVGGGFAGATAAKYLRMWSKGTVDVTLIERNTSFISCPMSNTVLGGSRSIKDLTRSYATLQQKYGIRLKHGEVRGVDAAAQTIMLADGSSLPYDRLILAPGVDFMFDQIEGLSAEVADRSIPHAWKAGAQTELLRQQLQAMPNGGVFVMSIPKAPFRCPPGPYERACQVASYLGKHKPGSKIIILDGNADIVAKKALFTAAWDELYPGMIEYRGNAGVSGVDVKTKTARTEMEDVKADVLNIIPPMKAGAVADMAGVVTADKRWCGVSFLSFESTVQKNIHVLGDAVAAALPKSGHMANAQAKACAAAILELLGGQQPDPQPVLANTCFSMVSASEAMHVANVFNYDKEKQLMVAAAGGGVSENRSSREGQQANAWLRNILADTLG